MILIKKVCVYFENCYGIPKLSETFDFQTRKKAYLIYAPNGAMKTSFANTFNDICLGEETIDHYYPNRITKRIVKNDSLEGEDLTKDDILVIPPYVESYKAENESTLLVDEKLKKEYEAIHNDINNKMEPVISNLRNLSGKRDAIQLIASDFGYSDKSIYDCFEEIENNYLNLGNDFESIKYGKLFTVDAEKILSDKEVINLLEDYLNEYERLLNSSSVFKKAFNHNNANDVLDTLDKTGFFKADHKILLSKSDTPLDKRLFGDEIQKEKERILNKELAPNFAKIDKVLSSKNATKDLRDILYNNRILIPELLNIPLLKKKIWVSYLNKEIRIFREAVLNYQNNRLRLKEITTRAKEQSTEWNTVVNQFNERFCNMPFKLDIDNKDDVILKSAMPIVIFKYKNRGDEVLLNETDLIRHLSTGERKALYLLNIIFEIQARKKNGTKTLLIMDDIADSFDYRNKYAIIEYIKDIIETDIFRTIILTHNFDFYRTLAGRVGIKPTTRFVVKNEYNLILEQGGYFDNVFTDWQSKVYDNNIIFLSAIAFIRNIVEYLRGNKDFIYNSLTSLLHYKPYQIDGVKSTDDILNEDVIKWYEEIWERDKSLFAQNRGQKVIDLLYDTAENLLNPDTNPIQIENKIVLSIAIRLKAETYMIKRINNPDKIKAIVGNQTRHLRSLITFNRADANEVIKEEIIERVLIMTSENIHINSFMYEPIIDMSLDELSNLYKKVKEL